MPIKTNELYYDITLQAWCPVSTLRTPRRPSTRPRDSQRQRVYNTERDVWVREEPMTLAEVEAFIRAVCERKYVRETFHFINRWKVRDGRGARRATASRDLLWNTLTFPVRMRQRWVILHEMAHVMRPNATADHPKDAWQWGAAHGWQYCYTYLLLVRNVLGKEAYNFLRDGFRQYNVKYRPPRSVK